MLAPVITSLSAAAIDVMLISSQLSSEDRKHGVQIAQQVLAVLSGWTCPPPQPLPGLLLLSKNVAPPPAQKRQRCLATLRAKPTERQAVALLLLPNEILLKVSCFVTTDFASSAAPPSSRSTPPSGTDPTSLLCAQCRSWSTLVCSSSLGC